jgi:peptidoglycan hydrolase-like protein with peptidoglycan-binding domain
MGWLADYERHEILGCTGPGTYKAGHPWRWVGHTTESNPGTIDAVISFFRGRPCSCPHFCIDPANGRKAQFIPTEWASAALKNLSGGVETNRAFAVQTEICGRAAETPNWPDEWLEFVGEHIADLVRAGVPLDLNNTPATKGPQDGTIATSHAPQRLPYATWLAFDGVCWHQHVPENDHWDGGKINMARIIEHAKASLAGQPVAPAPPAVPPPPAPPVGPRLLKKGMKGEDVHRWQSRLADRGYWITADGEFGSLTETVTRWFQKARGIGDDGIVGRASLDSMSAAERSGWKPSNMGGQPAPAVPPAPAAPPWPGRYLMVQKPLMKGNDVRVWQAQMAKRGWKIDVDGIFGEGSRKVCTQFQQEKNLAVDGVVGPTTWTKAWTATRS